MINQRYELTGSLDLCKGKLVPGLTANWGEVTGNIENQTDLVEYVSTHGGGVAAWGSISGNLSDQTDLMNKFSSYATESWVSGQGYLVQDDLSQYATRQWVTGRGYATESWVVSQSYLTSTALSGYATESWVTSQNYITSAYLTGYATESWVVSQSYITSSALSGYATESWVSSQYLPYNEFNFAFDAAITPWTNNYLKPVILSSYATQSWVSSQGYYIQASGETVLCTVQPTEMDPIVSTGLIVGNYIPSDFVEGVYLNNVGAGKIYYNYQTWEETVDPFITESGLPDYLTDYATKSWVSSQGYALNTDLTALMSRVSALEADYGDALTTTNNILGV